MLRIAPLALALGLSSPAAAECVGTTSLMDMQSDLGMAEAQFFDQDAIYKATASSALGKLPCLEHLLTPSKAVRVHLLVGATLAAEQPARAKLAFMAAKTLDPKLERPAWMASSTPAGRLFDEVRPAISESLPAPVPMSGALRFDGAEAEDRPVNYPTIFQRTDSTGRAVEAAYVWPEDDLPPYPSGKKKKKKKFETLINNVPR